MPSQRLECMQKSLECGQLYAHRMISDAGTDDSDSLARKLWHEVYSPKSPEKTYRVLLADFVKPNRINIFMYAESRAERLLSRESGRRILTDKMKPERVILSHEIFHHLEEKYGREIFTLTEKVCLWSLGSLHNDSGIYALLEIAAMLFAHELNRLPCSPYLMDVFLV